MTEQKYVGSLWDTPRSEWKSPVIRVDHDKLREYLKMQTLHISQPESRPLERYFPLEFVEVD